MSKEFKTQCVMYRPNAETLRKIDMLVAAGVFKSRTDAVDSYVQRGLAWEEYMRLVTSQLQNIAQDQVFINQMAEALLPTVKEKIKEIL